MTGTTRSSRDAGTGFRVDFSDEADVFRRSLLATSCLAAAGLAGLIVLFPRRAEGPGITLDNYDRIRAGMSRAEVERLLGGPEASYLTEWTDFERDPSRPFQLEKGEWWLDDNGGIIVSFDSAGRVTAAGWIRPKYGPKWSLRRCCRRIELWWEDLGEGPAARI
jgi:hypothetical protein